MNMKRYTKDILNGVVLKEWVIAGLQPVNISKVQDGMDHLGLTPADLSAPGRPFQVIGNELHITDIEQVKMYLADMPDPLNNGRTTYQNRTFQHLARKYNASQEPVPITAMILIDCSSLRQMIELGDIVLTKEGFIPEKDEPYKKVLSLLIEAIKKEEAMNLANVKAYVMSGFSAFS